jgi:hypothetical protein
MMRRDALQSILRGCRSFWSRRNEDRTQTRNHRRGPQRPERAPLFCIASGSDWQKAGVTGGCVVTAASVTPKPPQCQQFNNRGNAYQAQESQC